MLKLGRLCQGPIRRRECLRAGALALGGLTLPDVMAKRAAASAEGKGTSVILFWMWGGPSQLETFDMKPDAPSEYRGPLNPISTNVPGIEICEYMPLLAQRADRYSLVRSMHHKMSAHNDGSIEVLTGKTPAREDPTSQAISEHPDFGMVASRIRNAQARGIPQYVGAQKAPFMTRPVYLGVSHKAFETGNPAADDYEPRNLSLSDGMNLQRLEDRRGLLNQFDRFRRDAEEQSALRATDRFRNAAFDLLTSSDVAGAFDIKQESDETRDRYGRHRWGQSCLLARRLAEAGVAVINVDATAPNDTTKHFSWDDHAPAFHIDYAQRERLPQMDQALSALIDDLYDRGLDQDVLVLACGEFGRTPKLTHAPKNFSDQIGLGRDHWPHAFSVWVSGGGLRMGQVVGATNSRSEYPLKDPQTPQDLMATVYRHLGIDSEHTFDDFAGRPVPLLFSGKPIEALA
ncbi:MAG: DUF1501 domain-containing protein [Planctomycetota bacterium]|nr:MAG: DUF1501 domain-containing protein [Planctomycetota bacterium]REJ92545.1 MAG: DUF1501 domain-containing protein [Planctomycetota bacterium]REK24101.1 MAG: DUF1501 domain-containing protein [Planctomycetota bacterium]REK38321.1 MAG: DUF1501 domain-containing protein [Planctomycetota bacterium]